MGKMADIRKEWQIPARRGMRVRYTSPLRDRTTEGTIVGPSEDGTELRIKFDDMAVVQTVPPWVRLEYLEPEEPGDHETPD